MLSMNDKFVCKPILLSWFMSLISSTLLVRTGKKGRHAESWVKSRVNRHYGTYVSCLSTAHVSLVNADTTNKPQTP